MRCYLNLMINEQIFLWIIKNKQVYLHSLPKATQEETVKKYLTLVIDKLGKVIALRLKEGKTASFDNFFTFYIETEEKSGKVRPCIHINGSLKILTNFKQSHPKPNKADSNEVLVDIASALMLEQTLIEALLGIYIKAITDLISNRNELSLDLYFCRIKLSKKLSSCNFRTFFTSQLNQKIPDPKNQRILLHSCPNPKCLHPKQNTTTSSSHFYHTKWTQIKQGNLYNRPSLQEIKQLYDKGRQLQLKYHHFFI